MTTCFSSADLGSCKGPQDLTCLCNSPTFVASTAQCFQEQCKGDDLAQANAVAQQACQAVGVTITADRDMPDALLTDLLPAGLEIENFNLGDEKQWADVVVEGIEVTNRANAADVLHEEYRDDRYVAALKLHAGRAARVFYLVRAVTPGTYTVPPPLVEDMYRPDLRGVGRSNPTTITVVEP